jgi:hypothetical protein
MRVKFKGEWYEIQCFNITKNDGTAFITKDYENSIEDIEINGRHLAPDKDVATKTEAVEPQDNKPTEKVGEYEYTHICMSDKPEVGDEGASYAVFRSFDELNTGIAVASEELKNNIIHWHEQKEIDWEQRQFFLAAQIYAKRDFCSYQESMAEAKDFIKYYREVFES